MNCTKFKETKTLEYNGKRISLWERASEGQARQKQANKQKTKEKNNIFNKTNKSYKYVKFD